MIHEAHQRRSDLIHEGGTRAERILGNPFSRIIGHPGTVAIIVIGVFGLAWAAASSHDPAACKQRIIDDKKALQKIIEERRELQRTFQTPAVKPAAPAGPKPKTGFGNVFDPGNLNETGPEGSKTAPDQDSQANPPKPNTGFGNVFDPNNLNETGPQSDNS